jgi:oligopeptide/dipeptide ABC transporter ATP-binding protein
VRGRHIGYIPQSSLAGLNPVLTIGQQMVESVRVVEKISRADAEKRAIELLDRVRIPRAKQVFNNHSHELSGGMRQRVMIAAAIAQKPEILLADEPTTALDVTVQREILTLLTDIRKEFGMALILISHDLAVIESVCDQLVVMYAGATIETGPVEAIAADSRHPYTRSLRASRIEQVAPGEDIATIPGEPVSVGRWPAGCRFNPRCSFAIDACKVGEQPPLRPVHRQMSACIRAEELP